MRWLIIVVLFISCSSAQEEKKQLTSPTRSDSTNVRTEYTCPMHPNVVSQSPGECPECGMQLDVRS
ncbi:MAG: heavy metal-binding domain-containing protein [Bacteroidota bacterium]